MRAKISNGLPKNLIEKCTVLGPPLKHLVTESRDFVQQSLLNKILDAYDSVPPSYNVATQTNVAGLEPKRAPKFSEKYLLK